MDVLIDGIVALQLRKELKLPGDSQVRIGFQSTDIVISLAVGPYTEVRGVIRFEPLS